MTALALSQASSAYMANHEPDSYAQQSLSFKFRYRPAPNFNLSWQTRALAGRAELDAFGGPGGDDPNSIRSQLFLFNRLELDGFLQSPLGTRS